MREYLARTTPDILLLPLKISNSLKINQFTSFYSVTFYISMSWEQPVLDGMEGLHSLFMQVLPALLPIVAVLFLGVTIVVVVRRLAMVVS